MVTSSRNYLSRLCHLDTSNRCLSQVRDLRAGKAVDLSRQLEEKAGRLEDDLDELREEHAKIQAELEEKSRSEKSL